MDVLSYLTNSDFLRSGLAQIATVGLGFGGIALWLMTWRAWRRNRIDLLNSLSWFFLFFGVYRAFWVWWHFAGRPPEWGFGWHVTVMLWAIMAAMGLMIIDLFKNDRNA